MAYRQLQVPLERTASRRSYGSAGCGSCAVDLVEQGFEAGLLGLVQRSEDRLAESAIAALSPAMSSMPAGVALCPHDRAEQLDAAVARDLRFVHGRSTTS